MAVQGLNISWAEDHRKIMEIFDVMDRDKNDQERGTLGLDEIAIGVLDTVKCSYEKYEYEYLEQLYKIIKGQNMLSQIPDMMKFLNFQRDYTCTHQDFLSVIRKNFNISQVYI